MFPTTTWTTVRRAGESDEAALERFAEAYRGPVLRFLRRRGLREADAEDLCQEVFVRLLRGKILARADAARGRFRSLLLAVVTHVVQDSRRRRREPLAGDVEPSVPPAEFDREWTLELVERAFESLRREESPYYDVLAGHLDGAPQDRNRLWIARGKLLARIRHEIALTCRSPEDVAEEMAHLAPYLRPAKKG